MKQKQKDYLFEEFCREARYIAEAPYPYVINCNGKLLKSTDTRNLYLQYLAEIKAKGLETPTEKRTLRLADNVLADIEGKE